MGGRGGGKLTLLEYRNTRKYDSKRVDETNVGAVSKVEKINSTGAIIIASNRKLRCGCLNCRNEDRLITFNLDHETAAVILISTATQLARLTQFIARIIVHCPRAPVIKQKRLINTLILVSSSNILFDLVLRQRNNNRKLVFWKKEKKAKRKNRTI